MNTNAEIYYPPYLFTAAGGVAARPAITAAPTVADPGRTIAVSLASSRPAARVTLVKTGSATHGWNMEQRFVELPFIAQGSTLSVQVPSRASDVPPGMWMLFVIDDAGVPSAARMMRINVANAMNVAVAPTLAAPSPQVSTALVPVSLDLTASDPNQDALRFSASGLPPGLSIDAATGRISGAPVAAGVYTVVAAASDGYNSTSATFSWTVEASLPVTLEPLATAAPVQSGQAVTYRARASGNALRYRWEFGDGTAPTAWSSSPEASKTFVRPGWFYVTVTVADAAGTERRDTIVQSVHAPLAVGRPAASSGLLLEEAGGVLSRIWVVNPDNGSISVIDGRTRTRTAEIPVGRAPRTLARAADGSIWVTVKDDAAIAVVDPRTLAVSRTIALPRGSRPHGIVMARGGAAALVALEATGQVLRFSTADARGTGTLAVGPNPRHLSVAADGRTVYAARFITPPLPGEHTATVQTLRDGVAAGGEVVVFDAESLGIQSTIILAHDDRPDAENQGRGIPNYLGAAAVSPDGTQAFVPSKQDNILRGALRDGLPLNFQNTVRAVSSRIDLGAQREDRASRIDHDNASVASAAAFNPLGTLLFVALETSREVAVVDAHGRAQLMRIDVGRAPQDVAVSADGRILAVHNFMDRTVSLHDLGVLMERGLASAPTLATVSTVAVEQLAAAVLRGKQMFYDARDTRLARDRYMSCATCHNDGSHDGRIWDFTGQGEGLRNTVALNGRSGAHGMLHWSNNFDEVQDFEGQIRALAGGTGLMSDAAFLAGTRQQPLGDRKAGLSADLDALAAYVTSLDRFAPSPHRSAAATLSATALEGRLVFQSMNCATCHGGAAFTRSGINDPADIGTLKPSSGSRLSGPLTGIDVPTLRDVWATAPYLHDGSAATLEQAVAAHRGISVGASDMPRLVAYLRELGADEAAPGTGLLGQYFSGTTLSGAPWLTRTENVNFEWRAASPATGGPIDRFSARWTGTLVVPVSGNYVFSTVSDDGVRLWLDGTQRISNWRDHAAQTNSTSQIALTAGQRVTVRLEYYENSRNATIRLLWRPPGAASATPIPAAALLPN